MINNRSLFAACGGGETAELVGRRTIQPAIREGSRGRTATTEQKGEGVNCVGEVHFSIVIRIRGIRAGREAIAQEEVTQGMGRVGNIDSPVTVGIAANELGAAGYGHVELVYDFSDGGAADGWLHALFRYEDIESGHGADMPS